MKASFRTTLTLGVVALLVVGGTIAFFALVPTDIGIFTRKTQSLELPEGRILNIYRTSTFEYYDCKFEVRERRTGKVLIRKTPFYSTPYWSSKSVAGESSPETRTTFLPVVGAKSGVIGLVSTEDKGIVLLLIEPVRSQYVVATPIGLSQADEALGDRLLSDLKRDYPDRALVLEATEGAAKLRRR